MDFKTDFAGEVKLMLFYIFLTTSLLHIRHITGCTRTTKSCSVTQLDGIKCSVCVGVCVSGGGAG